MRVPGGGLIQKITLPHKNPFGHIGMRVPNVPQSAASLGKVFIKKRAIGYTRPGIQNLPSSTNAQALVRDINEFKFKNFAKLDNKNLSVDQAAKIVANDPTLKQNVTKIKKSAIKATAIIGFSATILITGGTTTAFWAGIEQYRREISGCRRFHIDEDGKLTVCKVVHLTCNGHTTNSRMCLLEDLTPAQQEAQKTKSCPPTSKSSAILSGYMCSSGTIDVNDINYIPDRNLIPPNVYYVCKEATFADALAELLYQLVNGISEAANSTFDIFKNILKGFAVFLVISAIIGFMILRYYMRQKSMRRLHDEIPVASDLYLDGMGFTLPSPRMADSRKIIPLPAPTTTTTSSSSPTTSSSPPPTTSSPHYINNK